MKRFTAVFTIVALLIAAFPVTIQAQSGNACTGLGTLVPLGKDTQTVSSTAALFTSAAILSGGKKAVMVFGYTTAAIRYWDDTSVPTAAVGMPVAAGGYFQVCGMKAVQQFLMIRQVGDSVVSYTTYTSEQ